MPALPNIAPETIAFWLGFLAATVFWWLAGRFRALLPKLAESIRKQIRASRRKSQEKVDEYLRRETLRRAQAMHLAAPLFSLDEVLVTPQLIVPPPQLYNQGVVGTDTVAGQVAPYLPDWPQLASQYPVSTISAAQAMQNHVKIMVMGKPGSGKTVTLAALASQAARKDPSLGELAEATPILLHALDLSLAIETPDPLDVLAGALAGKSSVLMQRQIPAFLRLMAKDGKLLLLLDGLDELPPEPLKKTSAYLEALGKKYPQIDMITSGAPEHLDGLTGQGFLPLAVRGWKVEDVQAFVRRWGELWSAHITPEIERRDPESKPLDPRLLDNWLLGEWGIYSPLEWTLRTWGAYAGDLTGPGAIEAVDAYIRRVTQNAIPSEALAKLAGEFIHQGQASLSYKHLEGILAHFKVTARPATETQAEGGESQARKPRTGKARDKKQISSGGRILDTLLECGVLVEHLGEQMRMVSPVITGMLAACQEEDWSLPTGFTPPYWSTALAAGRYLSGGSQGAALVQSLLAGADDPLFTRLLVAADWLSAGTGGAEWRPAVMRKMLQMLQRDGLSPLVQARLVAAFAASNDPSLPVLFKQLLGSSSDSVRRLAALGCGAIRSPKLVNELTSLMADPVPDVRMSACLALAAYGGKVAGEILPQVLMHGDESMQLAAAEALAITQEGQETLKEALGMDNLLVRRAAVLALAHMREPWAHALLEKVAVEDGQWIVRSAAAQAVENLQKPDTSIPARLPHASEASWLIAYAGKQGVGVIPGDVPVSLLLSALQDGSTEEKLSALLYLRDQPDATVLSAVYRTCQADQAVLSEAGFYTLWYLAASGVELPAMTAASAY